MLSDKIQSISKSAKNNTQDERVIRRNSKRYKSANIKTSPMIFTANLYPAWLENMYQGISAFLICGGPSFAQLDHKKLAQPGILTMGLNNAAKTFRPNLWVSVDSPDHFIKSVWMDPTITKFVPLSHKEKYIFDGNAWEWLETRVCDCPNVFYFRRNEHFQAERFLNEDTINWGNHRDFGGGRSVMLAAIRLLHILGVRRVFLLGCDMNMSEKANYHFDQNRSKDSIESNNSTYKKLNEWFQELRPFFEAEGFKIFNCNPKSRLTAFDYIGYETAVKETLNEWGNIDITSEKTDGLYDSRKPKKYILTSES